LRRELHPKGLEVVTVSLELSGPEASRSYIEAAQPEHPSLLDPTHQLDALFGVVNIPNVVWIDEQGTVVRPPEPGWPGGRTELPKTMMGSIPKLGRAPGAPKRSDANANPLAAIAAGQDRDLYPDAIRDWVDKGANSQYALSPAEVVAHSQPRPMSKSEGAAHFELATHLWQTGHPDLAIAHFAESHRLQPDNWTYKRQAWSLIGNKRVGGPFGRFAQGPLEGEEDDWPFPSDFWSDISMLDEGAYYPKTM
jgi:hypothetical protein